MALKLLLPPPDMAIGELQAQALVARAVGLYQEAGRPLPDSVATIADGVHSLDVKLSYDLKAALSAEAELATRAHYQRLRAGEGRSTPGAAEKRHALAGSAVAASGVYLPSEVAAKLPAKVKDPYSLSAQMTPSLLTPTQQRLHAAKRQAQADLARRTVEEGLTSAEVDQGLAAISKGMSEANLAAQDVAGALADRHRKLAELPWILRTLVYSMESWGGFVADGKRPPSVLGRLTGLAFPTKGALLTPGNLDAS
jgi:hypothetical protein